MRRDYYVVDSQANTLIINNTSVWSIRPACRPSSYPSLARWTSSFVIIARISQKQWDHLGLELPSAKKQNYWYATVVISAMQEQVRRTGERFFQREREGEREREREREKADEMMGDSGSSHRNISIQVDMHAWSSPSPACNRSCVAAEIDRCCGIGMQLIMRRSSSARVIFAGCASKENHAARVACNQSHVVNARDALFSALCRPRIRSPDRKYRARTFLRRQRLSACPFLTTRAVYCQRKFFFILYTRITKASWSRPTTKVYAMILRLKGTRKNFSRKRTFCLIYLKPKYRPAYNT